jgi:EmrB/QacA subfamily drug resistance transporter
MTSSSPLSHREILTAFAGILLAIMLSALDQTVVTPALTAISTDLRALDGLSWIIVAYLLTSTATTPIYGKLSDLYGRGRLMVVAIVLFVAASVLCAMSQTLVQLVFARAVQGIGGGGLIVVAQAMIADFVSPRQRGKYQAYIAAMWAFAGIAGPPVGGLLADHAGWRWIFWLNVPLGILALVLCRRAAVKLALPAWRSPKIDYVGALLLVPGVSALLIWTSEARTVPWPPTVSLALAGGLVLLAGFAVRETRAAEPLIPPRLYANRIILFTNVIAFCVSTLQFAGLVLLPVFFQIVMGMPAADSGLMVVPMLCGIPISSLASGQIMGRTGHYKPIIPCALGLATVSFFLFATMKATTPLPAIIGYVALLGLGLGACFPVLMISTQNAAEAGDIGAATSSVTFSRSLGASFGTAMFWAILLAPLSLASIGSAQTLFRYGRNGLARLPAPEQAALLSSLTAGFQHVFLVGAGIGLATLLFALFLREEPLKTSPRGNLAQPSSANA